MMVNEDYSKPEDCFVQSLDVHTLVPQAEPFLMVSRLEHFEMQRVVSSLKVTEENFFVENGKFETTGLLENIAQTCALRLGYINRYILGQGIQIGFVGGVDNLTANGEPGIGDTLMTEIQVKAELGGYLLAHAVVMNDVHELMSADIKIAVKE